METITKFDKPTLKLLRPEIDKSLAELSERFGITLKIGNIRYDDDTFTSKIEASLVGADLKANDWSKHFWRFGMEEDWLGRTFEYDGDGQDYKIVGLKSRARKNQILIERLGKTYRVDAAMICLKMGKEKEAA
jgi:hypothetical protein|tara:strand:- start:648 stop:1046 length:399 start_codon:yes stop_codon:yes gene_type:complete